MRVFVYEHLSSGALAGQPGVDSLRREGLAMLAAVLADLSRCPDVCPVTLVEPDLHGTLATRCATTRIELFRRDAESSERSARANAQRRGRGNVGANALRSEDSASRLNGASDDEPIFRQLARGADFTLVIAPEFDDLLEERCRWAIAESSRLLGPSPNAVRLTGDKLALADRLRRHGVPTPHTALCVGDDPPWPYPVVCKPRFGAGSQHTLRINNRDEYAAVRERLCGEPSSLREGIVQPLIPGRAASISFLAGPNECIALPACGQYLSEDGCFSYLGGCVPFGLESRLQPAKAGTPARAQRLAKRAVDAVDGLTGYFGVDLVLGDSADGSGDAVIEINPRLTTSYVGLRQLTPGNLMQVLLDLALGKSTEPLEWYDKLVRFHPDGRIE